MSAEAPVNIRSDSEEESETSGAGSQLSSGAVPKADVKRGIECNTVVYIATGKPSAVRQDWLRQDRLRQDQLRQDQLRRD